MSLCAGSHNLERELERLDGECLALTIDLDPHVNPDIVADVATVDLMGLVGRDVVTDVFVAMPCGGDSPLLLTFISHSMVLWLILPMMAARPKGAAMTLAPRTSSMFAELAWKRISVEEAGRRSTKHNNIIVSDVVGRPMQFPTHGCGSADTLMDSSAPTMTPWLEAWRAEQGFKCQAAAYLGHLAVGVTVHWFGHVLEGLRRQR